MGNQGGGKTFIGNQDRSNCGQVFRERSAHPRNLGGQVCKSGQTIIHVQAVRRVIDGDDDERLIRGVVGSEGIVVARIDDLKTGPDVLAELAHHKKLFVDGVGAAAAIERVVKKSPTAGVVHDLPVNPGAHPRAGDIVVNPPRHRQAGGVTVAVFGNPRGLLQAGGEVAQADRIVCAVSVRGD